MCDVLKQKLIVTGNAMQGPIKERRQISTRYNNRIHKTSTEIQYFHFYKLILQSMSWLEKIRANIPCRAIADVKDNEKSQIVFA